MMYHNIRYFTVLCLFGLFGFHNVFSATPVDLKHHPLSFLQSLVTGLKDSHDGITLEKISSHTDFNNTAHVRMKQQYHGFPVWGGDIVVHAPKQNMKPFSLLVADQNARMNGLIYLNLAADLGHVLPKLDSDQKEKVLSHVTNLYQKSINKSVLISHSKANLMVYIDQNNKAHWAYYVEFFAPLNDAAPTQPVYILDAHTYEIYQSWNNLHTVEKNMEFVAAGGYGGNEKIGVINFDGSTRDAPAFSILRDEETSLCYLQGAASINPIINTETSFFEVRNGEDFPGALSTPVQFDCPETDNEHRGVYWNGDSNYLADNNAFYHANVTNNMYILWYASPAFFLGENQDGEPLPVRLNTHVNFLGANAFWFGLTNEVYFSDGDIEEGILPLTSLDVVAHELSHAFTQQHANLIYKGQSGGLNESFSDMAAVAAGYFTHGESTWKIGSDILLIKDALRYIDNPRHDCVGKRPWDEMGIRQCSIDHMKDYKEGTVTVGSISTEIPLVDVHFSSGIFNKAFYLIAKGFGGDEQEGTRKAFNIMVQANGSYWTPNVNFISAACGVLEATRDYGYDESVVVNAFSAVGIDIKTC